MESCYYFLRVSFSQQPVECWSVPYGVVFSPAIRISIGDSRPVCLLTRKDRQFYQIKMSSPMQAW